MAKFLVVDDEPADVALLRGLLEKLGHEVVTAGTAAGGLALVQRETPDVALLDIMLPDENGLEVYQQMRALDGKLPILFVTASASSNLAIEAMQLGAFDYLTKPLDVRTVRRAIERALEVRRMASEPVSMDPTPPHTEEGDVIIGRSPAMQDVYKAIGLVASQDVTVLIRGESGTGKELVARAVYHFSKRADQPFLAVNCAAIPEALLESELFGHERGAFTGADKRRIGKFEQCNRGTLFLDEIGDMPLLLQSKILRVLQNQTFERVGGNRTINTDVRVVAATHCDLESMVQTGAFREDLLYRLNGYTIQLPPLRDRGADLELLIDHFRRQANADLGKQVRGITAEAMAVLNAYRWPGNVRELENVIRQAVLKTNGPVILPEFLPEHVLQGLRGRTDAPLSETVPGSLQHLIDETLRSGSHRVYDKVVDVVEAELVRRALHYTGGDQLRAMQLLGVNPATFRSTAALKLFELDLARTNTASGTDRGTDAAQEDPLIRPGMTMEQIEREAIRRALDKTRGRRAEAAQMLGLSVRTLQRKIKEFDLK